MFLVWKLLFLEAWLLVDWPDAVVKSDAVVISLDRNWLELVLETEAWCAACFSSLSCCFFSIRVLIPAIFLEEDQVLGAASEGGGLIWVLFIVMDCGGIKRKWQELFVVNFDVKRFILDSSSLDVKDSSRDSFHDGSTPIHVHTPVGQLCSIKNSRFRWRFTHSMTYWLTHDPRSFIVGANYVAVYLSLYVRAYCPLK